MVLFQIERQAMFKATFICVLVLSVFSVCELASAAAPKSSANGAGQQGSAVGNDVQMEPHVEEGRVKINLGTQQMTVAQDNKVPLDLHGYAVSRIVGSWKFSEPYIESQVIAEPENLTLQHAEDGSAYVNFVPIRLGKLQLRIYVAFKDGGFDTDSVEVNVDRLPEQAPQRFILSDPAVRIDFKRKAGTLHLALSAHSPAELLIPVAFYQGINSPIPFNPIPATLLNDIVFTVVTRRNQRSPIAFNPSTGEVKAVMVGQALVKATLNGKSAYACVDVMPRADDWNQRSNCNDFLPPGLTEPLDEPLQEPKRAGP